MRATIFPFILILSAALLIGSYSARAHAQSDKKVTTNTLDLAVPSSPAFTALGLDPTDVIHPSTPWELASTILNGADKNGNIQTGLALDVSPYLLFVGNNITLNDYQTKRAVRFFSRMQFSAGTTKGLSDDDPSARVAVGLRFSVFDRADPRCDDQLTKCLIQAANSAFESTPPLPPPSDSASPNETERLISNHQQRVGRAASTVAESCRAAFEARRWNNSSWIIGGAVRGFSDTGKMDDLKWEGISFWTSIGYGFEGVRRLEDSSQLILLYKFLYRERIPLEGKEGQFSTQDMHMVGGRARFGTNHINVSIEQVYVWRKPIGGTRESSYRWSITTEKKLSNGLWLEASYGGDSSKIAGDSNSIVTSLKWGFSQRD